MTRRVAAAGLGMLKANRTWFVAPEAQFLMNAGWMSSPSPADASQERDEDDPYARRAG